MTTGGRESGLAVAQTWADETQGRLDEGRARPTYHVDGVDSIHVLRVKQVTVQGERARRRMVQNRGETFSGAQRCGHKQTHTAVASPTPTHLGQLGDHLAVQAVRLVGRHGAGLVAGVAEEDRGLREELARRQ